MNGADRHKLSVIIPCWNCANEVGEMLDSILAQTFRDWIVFCIDDHSTDGTQKILKKYEIKDSRIHCLTRNREPKGAQTCRNIGFDLSEGTDYVIWFDSDDVIAPYCFEQRVRYMESHPQLDFAVFPAKSFSNDLFEYENSHLFGYMYNEVDDLCRFLRRTLPFVGWTNIYRRSSLVVSQLIWDEKILSLQDSDFNIQSIIKGLNYDYAADAKIDYFWRIKPSSNSISKNIFTEDHKKSHLYFVDKVYNSLSSDKKREYHIEFDDYLFFFIDRFWIDKRFVKALLKLKFIKRRVFFCFRIRVYCMLHTRCKKYLFPYLSQYRKVYDVYYNRYNKKLLTKYCKELMW